MSTILSEMGDLVRMAPSLAASVEETASWYDRKAQLFDHIAVEAGATTPEAAHATAEAASAREHTRRLLRGLEPGLRDAA